MVQLLAAYPLAGGIGDERGREHRQHQAAAGGRLRQDDDRGERRAADARELGDQAKDYDRTGRLAGEYLP